MKLRGSFDFNKMKKACGINSNEKLTGKSIMFKETYNNGSEYPLQGGTAGISDTVKFSPGDEIRIIKASIGDAYNPDILEFEYIN